MANEWRGRGIATEAHGRFTTLQTVHRDKLTTIPIIVGIGGREFDQPLVNLPALFRTTKYALVSAISLHVVAVI